MATKKMHPTMRRLLQAATEEFATHGIAGARVDRIAAAAKANKALIYSYFGNKDQLFDAVMEAQVARVLDEVAFTPEDLPGYAASLFDSSSPTRTSCGWPPGTASSAPAGAGRPGP